MGVYSTAMKRWAVGLPFLALAVLQFGCSEAPKAPADTRAADEKTIRDQEIEWSKALQAKDLEKDMANYDNDAAFLLTNMPIVSGKTAIRGVHQQLFSDPNISIDFATSKAEVSKGGDLAYTQGVYHLTSTDPKTKRPVSETGKYVTVYKKQADGSWKAVEDMLNADAPAVGPAGPARAAKVAKTAKKAKKGKR
jgi:ketosteroid isomerase-like protein